MTFLLLLFVDTLSTVGVDVGIWKYRKDLDGDPPRGKRKTGNKSMRSVTFYTWDFGGQEEYYVTHQCFLSTRSLYLVVWNVMEGETGIDQLGPWLHNIQVRGSKGGALTTRGPWLHDDQVRRGRVTEGQSGIGRGSFQGLVVLALGFGTFGFKIWFCLS